MAGSMHDSQALLNHLSTPCIACLQSLEDMVAEEEAFLQAGKASPADVFSLYLNCCSNPGVINIATQDAVPISLAYLHASLLKYAGDN